MRRSSESALTLGGKSKVFGSKCADRGLRRRITDELCFSSVELNVDLKYFQRMEGNFWEIQVLFNNSTILEKIRKNRRSCKTARTEIIINSQCLKLLPKTIPSYRGSELDDE